jgi:hypothetical protein
MCLALAGCGSSGPDVEIKTVLTGKILKGGQPLVVNSAEYGGYAHVEVILIQDVSGGKSYTATAAEDGSFQVDVFDGEPILPGNYRVAVHQWNTAPDVDVLQGKYSESNTPVVVEVTASDEPLVIDLDQPTG